MNLLQNYFKALTLCATVMINTAFGSSLLEIYHDALDNDPSYQAAKSAYQAAIEAKPQAWALLLPTITGDGTWSHTHAAGTNTTHDFTKTYTLTLSQSLISVQNWYNVKKAGATVEKAYATFKAAKLALMTRTAKAYFSVLEAEDNLQFTRAEKEATLQRLKQTKQKFKVGLVAVTDVKQTQASYDTIVATEISAINNINNKKEELRKITGRYYKHLVSLKKDIPLLQPQPASIEQWSETSRSQNYTVLAARAATQEAKDTYSAAMGAFFPTLSAAASHGPSHSSNTDITTRTTTGTLTLSLPIINGGNDISVMRQNRHLYAAARHDLEGVIRKATNDTRQNYSGIISGISKIKADKQVIVSSKSALESTTAAFKVGTNTMLDVLQKQSDLYQAQRQLSRDLYLYVNEALALKENAGTLTEEDMLLINNWLALPPTPKPVSSSIPR